MLQSWMNVAMLALESQQVITMRCLRFAAGGPGVEDEARLMVAEKVAAAMRACGAVMAGASPDDLVRGYRQKVRANVRRLSR